MINRKFGIVLIIVSALIALLLFAVMNKLTVISIDLGCFTNNEECLRVNSYMSLLHIAIGVIAFLFSLGVYLIFFSRAEESIIKRLEDEKEKSLEEEKFKILTKGLDEYENQVLNFIREMEGITQASLRFKLDLSKAKISEVVSGLEKKKIVRRKKEGKTYKLYYEGNI